MEALAGESARGVCWCTLTTETALFTGVLPPLLRFVAPPIILFPPSLTDEIVGAAAADDDDDDDEKLGLSAYEVASKEEEPSVDDNDLLLLDPGGVAASICDANLLAAARAGFGAVNAEDDEDEMG